MQTNILWLPETDSTNEYVKAHAEELSEYDVVATTRQTAGKGTHGRNFFSEGGVYFSFFLRPTEEKVPHLTRIAAVAAQHALETGFDAKTKIKWVNDLYKDGKKVCGILCERTGDVVVVGIGLNLCEPEGGFPADIREIAGSLFSYAPGKTEIEEIVTSVVRWFIILYEDDDPTLLNAIYDELLLGKGRRVAVENGEKTYEGVLLGVDDDGYLRVRGDGDERTFFSGTLRFLS